LGGTFYNPAIVGFVLLPCLTIFLCAYANWRLENTRMVTGAFFLFSAIPAFANITLLLVAFIYTFIGFCSAAAALKIKKMLKERKGLSSEGE